MLLTSNDIAPKSGTYNVVAPDGTINGTLEISVGDVLPPTPNSFFHFEIDTSDLEIAKAFLNL